MIPRETAKRLSASSTDEDGILLVTFSNDDWPEPRRYASRGPEMQIVDGQPRFGVTSNGAWYDHTVVTMLLADDRDGDLPSVPLTFENVATDMGALADEEIENISVDLVVVALTDPDQVLGEVRELDIIGAEASDETLALELGYRTISMEPWPAWRMNKQNTPGIFL